MAALIRDVKRDMQEIEQRHLYGGSIESAPPENSRAIDPSVTEMALGEEDGRKMNEVLASDSATAAQATPWRPFWDEQLVGARDVTMDTVYQIPRLHLPSSSHPVLAHLQNLASNTDIPRLAVFLSSGILSTLPSINENNNLAPWLFRLACEAPDELANAAQQALHTGARSHQYHIEFSYLMSPILGLGPIKDAILPFGCSAATISPPQDPITRNSVVTRFVSTIKMIRGMMSQKPENIVILLFLIYLDSSTSNEVRRDISLVVEDILVSIAGGSDVQGQVQELVICKRVVETTASFRLIEKRMILDCVFGGQPAPRRFMRWIAVGFLSPEAVQALDWSTYLQSPSLSPFADMVTPALMSKSPFRISSKTDYYDLHNRVDILGTVLTDIRLYSATEDVNIERIMTGLEHLHGKIVDARAAFIERTRAKDALQRLRLRVYFQFQRTIKPTATIEAMLKR